ncbi:MAG TPA: site-2 protease family protein [Myxococcota bacterium]|nr:site-2 protease family protein [Myxococcota bacterium]
MRWSWKLGEVAGIGIYIHATFLLIVGWVALQHWLPARSGMAALAGVSFVLALFVCVVLHELGHALAARRYGIRTRDITLLPIGGVARLERVPEQPRGELFVAIAGPTVNLLIAAALFFWLWLAHGLEPLEGLGVATGPFLERLFWTNVFLAGFNLLPAFPMDGGRVLRALLATRLSYPRATELAAYIGQAIALGFGFLGLFYNPFLVFIALFVWMGASSEAGMVQLRAALNGMPVSRAMMTDFASLSPADPLSRAAELTLASSQRDFPVVDGGQVVGVLRQNDLLGGLSGGGHGAPVSDFMCRSVEPVDSHAMLSDVFTRLEGAECRTVPITHSGALVGLLSMENLGEFLRINGALRARRNRR